MLAFIARAMCGLLILLGLAHKDYRSAHNSPGSSPAQVANAAPSAIPIAVSGAELPTNYLKQKVYRVYRVTAYCDRGLTASGVRSGVGQCAAPADIPFGSRIYIPALERTFIVTDRTAKRFRRNTVDLFIPDRAKCREFGRRYLECEINTPVRVPRYGSPRLCAAVDALRESPRSSSALH